LDLLAALSYLVQGHTENFKAVFRAWWEVVGWRKRLLEQRRHIRSTVQAESKHIYRGSLLVQYLIGHRRCSDLLP
ncbi:MAG: glycosyltransferase family 2 protein, partial [Alistipes sp.]|nr:glycosyltransferase family 2 protein [Alistipes sp.]